MCELCHRSKKCEDIKPSRDIAKYLRNPICLVEIEDIILLLNNLDCAIIIIIDLRLLLKPIPMNTFKSKINLISITLLLTFASCSKQDIIVNKTIFSEAVLDVSDDMARKIAENFLDQEMLQPSIKGELKSSILTDREIKDIVTYTDENGNPTIHVVLFDPEGFVLISGIRKEIPILALSETGNFSLDENNLALTQWFKGREEKIKWLRADTSNVEEEVETLWQGILPPPGEEETEPGTTYNIQEGPLLSTNWGQLDGYNDSIVCYSIYIPGKGLYETCNCTTTENGKEPIGCVAVAQGQVMRYWEYPNAYDYTSMPDNVGSAETARFLFDIADDIDTEYDCLISISTVDRCPGSLVSYGYSNGGTKVDYDSDVLIDQIDDCYPVIMAGSDAVYGGHAWVCDGYRRYKLTTIHNPGTINEYVTYEYTPPYFHMNWGWYDQGVNNNAWYYYDDFDPLGLGFDNIEMITNIYP